MKLVALVVSLLACCSLVHATSAEDACGGTYRGFQYTISSPNYPSNYPTRTECIYRLEGEATSKCEQQFHLQFLDFNLKASEGCKGDYLQVGDSNFYCGNTAGLRKFTGTNNTLILTFHSDAKDTAKGFKILVSALPCSLKLSPLRNSAQKLGVPEAGRSSWQAREIESTAYRRGIRGDDGVNNSLTSSLNPQANDLSSSTIRRDQVGSAAASESNSVINGNRYYSDNDSASPRITSYLFLPPKETSANVTLHYQLGPSTSSSSSSSSSSNGRGVTSPPPMDLLPPRINSATSFSGRDALAPEASNVKKIGGVPARNYGEPGLAYSVDYELPSVQSSDCDKSNQVLQSNDGSFDRINYDPVQSAGYGSSPNLVYDPKYGLVGSNAYPGGSAGYYPPNNGNPGSFYPGYPTGYPGSGGSGFYPSYPSAGYELNYPGFDPVNPWIGSSVECCRVPSGRRFSIVSPGFPGGLGFNNGQLSCRYTIVKSSPDVCRLRLNFRFFNFGVDEPYCSRGYLDVDGQRFCGCRTGQSVQLLFGDYLVKTISIFGAGYPGSRLGGFLIDVVQEPCNLQASYPPPYNPIYPGGGGYIRRRSANVSDIVPSPLDPNPFVRDKRDLGYSYPKPNVPFLDKDVEFIPNVANKVQTHERFFAGTCQSRLLFDWAIASKEAFFKNARCTPTTVYGVPGFGARFSRSYKSPAGDETIDCQEINGNQGEIKSPLYPNVYPANVRKCYRFNRAPNFCKLEVYVRDFDLESSQDCANDYLSFSVEPKKYCGRSLNDFRAVFDLTQTSSLEVDFVSDDHGTGRGFDIGFSQLPCSQESILTR